MALPTLHLNSAPYSLPTFATNNEIEIGWNKVLEMQQDNSARAIPLYNGPLYHVDCGSIKKNFERIFVQEGLYYKDLIGLRQNLRWMQEYKNDPLKPLSH